MIAQLDKFFYSLSKRKTITRLKSYFFWEGRPLTTKGQWVNPFIFFIFKLRLKLHRKNKVVKPIFILGTGRSGTTILGLTMGIHKDVGFLNEPKAMWFFINPKDDLIGSYTNGFAEYRLDCDPISKDVEFKAHKLFSSYLTSVNEKRVVDKYPEMIFRKKYLEAIFPDAKFIFLTRNGYDTCFSIDNWSKRLGVSSSGGVHDWWGEDDRKWEFLCRDIIAHDIELSPYLKDISKYKDHTHRAAVEWIVTMKEGLKISNDTNVHTLKYEEFVSSKNVRCELLEFCELSKDMNFDKYCQLVLTPISHKVNFNLPDEISKEFMNVMKKLKYEE
jgi:hypothetical protein